MLKVLGIKNKSDIIGKNIFYYVADDYKEIAKKNVFRNSKEPYEINLMNSKNEVLSVLMRGETITKNNKTIRISSFIDITEFKKSQRIIEEQSKLASMGEMIGNIAHQWRQPLSVISTGASGLIVSKEFDTLTDKEVVDVCTTINDNAQYLSRTIDDFRNFIQDNKTKKVFDLKKDIESFIHLVESIIKNNNINMVLDIDENIKIDGYENELIQCFINIFNNAKDAFVVNNIENKLIFICTSQEHDKCIIKIKDNAGGIPKDILSKIFEPYFTTKHQSIGTGLGLNMTYNLIVDGIKGSIKATNETYDYEDTKYTGAEFTIVLPMN